MYYLEFAIKRSGGEPKFTFYCYPNADMLLQEYELDLDLISDVN